MFASIKAFLVARRTARLHKVLSQYMSSVQCMIEITVPKALNLYQNIGETLIDKTVEDPQPMLDLLSAVEKCVKLYGPGLKANVARYKADLNEADTSKLKEKINALCQSVLDIQRDVH